MQRAYRVRRSCLAVPASSERFINKARSLQAIDGPYLKVRDVDGFRRSAASAAALGYDGKWVLHPSQIDAANQAFAPSAADYSRATQIIEAYSHATTVDQRGAVMLGEEMIDEASRRMAEVIVARGNAAGFAPPESVKPRTPIRADKGSDGTICYAQASNGINRTIDAVFTPERPNR